MTTSNLIEKLHIELTAIHGQVHPDVIATIVSIGDRIDLLEKTSLVLIASLKSRDMDGFQAALRILEVTMLPPPEMPPVVGEVAS